MAMAICTSLFKCPAMLDCFRRFGWDIRPRIKVGGTKFASMFLWTIPIELSLDGKAHLYITNKYEETQTHTHQVVYCTQGGIQSVVGFGCIHVYHPKCTVGCTRIKREG